MSSDFLDLLFHPDTFFARKTTETPDYLVPALIVGSISLLSLIAPYFPGLILPHTIPVTVIVTLPEIIMNVAGPFITWFLVSLCLFAICSFFSGTGTFPATFRCAGYGMLPVALVTLIEVLTSPFLSPQSVMMIPLWAIMAIIYGEFVLFVVFLVWNGYIWMAAMEKVHAIPQRYAIIAATGSLFLFITLKLIYLPIV
ncbi:Yip1 family protein [Methanoregula sp.]|uniref:Yip1 family protein n=1 Tax=Methanoregula sp. TaxID=2052170 RepID=UPI002B87DB39|nr:Yip1 family protein [Methanoregula sp.]HVP95900.1 Yip1 family protein [Methanoregula sp.]